MTDNAVEGATIKKLDETLVAELVRLRVDLAELRGQMAAVLMAVGERTEVETGTRYSFRLPYNTVAAARRLTDTQIRDYSPGYGADRPVVFDLWVAKGAIGCPKR